VQSVERALALLDAIADGPPGGKTVAELALACAINRATAWRLLATLERRGLVDRDPATNRYQIGYTVARLAAVSGVDGLVRRSHHVLERICAQTGEAADLAVGRRSGLVYIDEVAPQAVLTVNWLARPVPLHGHLHRQGLAGLAARAGGTRCAWPGPGGLHGRHRHRRLATAR